jgi:(S)-2-hydroxyglutarate dehydrogenase
MGQKCDFDIVVIGGGIVGVASAYKIAANYSDIRIAVLEKENRLAAHQTGRNSGVIHSGLYYKPGSSKAKTCTKGRKELTIFAKEHNIPVEICGKVIVATDESELPKLDELFEKGQANEVEGIEKLTGHQIREIEPFCAGIAGLKVPCTGIIDYIRVTEKLAELVLKKNRDNKILTGHKVTGLEKHDSYTNVITNQRQITARYIINCAGLHSDRVAKMDGLEPGVRIVPFRGDYYELTEKAGSKIKNLVYPVPDPTFPFLGVHFTRMTDGSVECGPNAVFSFKREGYGKLDFSLKDTWDSLAFFGTWKMFMRHWRYGLGEYTRAFSKSLFLRQLQRLIPSIEADDIKPGKAGVRAQALGPKGELIDDFKVERQGNAIHILNAPSPAATASLAIGEYVSQIAGEYFGL